MTVTDKWAGYFSRLDKSVHICMLLTKRMLLVMDKNVGLCLYIYKYFNTYLEAVLEASVVGDRGLTTY